MKFDRNFSLYNDLLMKLLFATELSALTKEGESAKKLTYV